MLTGHEILESFEEFMLTEASAAFSGMKFTVSSSVDRDRLIVQFIPDGKTLDSFSNEEMSASIKSRLNYSAKDIGDLLEEVPGYRGAGLAFALNRFDLVTTITRKLK